MSMYDEPKYVDADVERLQASTQQYYVENIVNLIHNGFTPQSAIDAVVSNDLTKLETKATASTRALRAAAAARDVENA